jgi:hypothetical protein
MKIAIFGYPRSGTTMLYHIILQHLISAGLVEEWSGIGEVFNPLDGTMLVRKSGHLINYTNLDLPESQPRENRLWLFREHTDDDYIIKMLPYDINTKGVVNAVMEAGYNIIAIERRNPLSAFLSVIIAYHYNVWNVKDTNELPIYEPFVVSKDIILALGKSLGVYHHIRDRLNPSAILYYEDIATQPVEATLKQAGVYQEGVVTKGSPTKKILSFEDKIKLVINLEEVIAHLNGILMAYDVTMEHNDL